MLNDLEILCAAPGVSGDEGGAAEAAEFLLSPLGEVTRTPLGSVLCRMKPARAGLPHVMLTAHLDSIGMMVTQITDKGFVKAAPCGGLDRRSLSGARVTVHATGEGRETLPGVILATPPHLSDGKSIPPKADRLVVDIGMGAEAARRKLNYGDRITLDGPLTPLLGDRVAAPPRSTTAPDARRSSARQSCCGKVRRLKFRWRWSARRRSVRRALRPQPMRWLRILPLPLMFRSARPQTTGRRTAPKSARGR